LDGEMVELVVTEDDFTLSVLEREQTHCPFFLRPNGHYPRL
jgi:hypothetical protein